MDMEVVDSWKLRPARVLHIKSDDNKESSNKRSQQSRYCRVDQMTMIKVSMGCLCLSVVFFDCFVLISTIMFCFWKGMSEGRMSQG